MSLLGWALAIILNMILFPFTVHDAYLKIQEKGFDQFVDQEWKLCIFLLLQVFVIFVWPALIAAHHAIEAVDLLKKERKDG